MNEFEGIKKKIKEYANQADPHRKERIQEEISVVEADIRQMKVSADKEADEGKVAEYQKYSAQREMLEHRLEKLQNDMTVTEYPPITASQYSDIMNELRKTMRQIEKQKYTGLLDLLEQGKGIIEELRSAIKEYNATYNELHRLISGSESDSKGYTYPTFTLTDAFEIDRRIMDVFVESNSIHSFKYYLKNKIGR